jgi:hypothetical protein
MFRSVRPQPAIAQCAEGVGLAALDFSHTDLLPKMWLVLTRNAARMAFLHTLLE